MIFHYFTRYPRYIAIYHYPSFVRHPIPLPGRRRAWSEQSKMSATEKREQLLINPFLYLSSATRTYRSNFITRIPRSNYLYGDRQRARASPSPAPLRRACSKICQQNRLSNFFFFFNSHVFPRNH